MRPTSNRPWGREEHDRIVTPISWVSHLLLYVTHQNCGAVALRQVPGHGDVEVEAVLVHARVGVPHLLAEEAGPGLEADLHARVGEAVRVQDSRPPASELRVGLEKVESGYVKLGEKIHIENAEVGSLFYFSNIFSI